MTFILAMSAAHQCPRDELSCPNQRAEKTLLHDAAGDDDYPTLQLATVEATASVKQPASTLPGHDIESLLQSIED